jgi:transketolase
MTHLLEHYLNEKRVEQKPTRDGFGEALAEMGSKNEQIVGITADLNESTRMEAFSKACPDRFFDVGVAEQNMMGIAAGLALSGKIPFITSYATFNPGRNWDQFRVSVCYSQANVKVIGCHSGLSVGPDGATHQALEDIAMTRVLPNLVVLAPCDANQAHQATLAMADYTGPVYMRLTREKSPVFLSDSAPFTIGKAQHVMTGSDVTIIACGPIAYEAMQAVDLLKDEDITCDVILSPSIKPLDAETICASAEKTGAVVTVEEHQITGGLGGAVAEVLGEQCPTPLERVGMLDTFGESGNPSELFAKYKLDRHAIVAAAKRAIKRKKA